MVTITATPNEDLAAVRLYVAAPSPYQLTTLTRTDTYGTRAVRLYEDAELIGGVLQVIDAEAALAGLIRYDVRVRSGADTQTATATTALDADPYTYTLAPVGLPHMAVAVDMVTGYAATQDTTAIVHDVIGRPDPLVTLGVQRTRAGQLTAWCSSYTSARAVGTVLGSGEIVHLRQSDYPGLDMYLMPTATQHAPVALDTPTPRWQVVCDYRETGVPTGPLLGSLGWTIAASTARNGTLAASRDEFPTVLDLLIGPPL